MLDIEPNLGSVRLHGLHPLAFAVFCLSQVRILSCMVKTDDIGFRHDALPTSTGFVVLSLVCLFIDFIEPSSLSLSWYHSCLAGLVIHPDLKMSAGWCRWLPHKEHSPRTILAHKVIMRLRLVVICNLVSCVRRGTTCHLNNLLLGQTCVSGTSVGGASTPYSEQCDCDE